MVERVIDIVLDKTETAIFLLHQEHDVLGSNPSPATNWQAFWGQYNPEEKGTTENCEKPGWKRAIPHLRSVKPHIKFKKGDNTLITKSVLINTIDNVKKLCAAASDTEYDIDLVSGRYVIDAKSIMGIFSLDLSKKLDIRVHTDDEEAANVFFDKISGMVQ